MKLVFLRLLQAAKAVEAHYEYDADYCVRMRPPDGCKRCAAMIRLRKAIKNAEKAND